MEVRFVAWPLAAADTVGSSSSDDAGATTSLQAPQAQQLQFNFCAGGGQYKKKLLLNSTSSAHDAAGSSHGSSGDGGWRSAPAAPRPPPRRSQQQQQQPPSPRHRHDGAAGAGSTDGMTGAVAALSSGLVPALCLGEVFAPASTLTGLMKASASADAEARRRRDDPLPEDPATALLLSLVQPWPLHTRPPGGTSSVRALFVTRQAAEAAREELLLARYAELIAARAAAGLPTTAAGEAARRAAMRAPGRPGGSGGSGGGGGGGGGGRGPHDHHGHSGPAAAAAAAAAAGHHSALDTATASPQGWLRSLVSALLPQAQPPPLLPSPSVHRQAGGRQADGPDDVGAQQQMKQQMKQHGLPQSTATPLPLGSPPSVRHAGLPALLAAQLSAFVGDLSSLEDESVLREGETLLQARRSRQGGSSSSSSSRRRGSTSDTNAAAAAAAAAASTASGSMAGAATAFSFASHVVRMPLAAALSALQAQWGADAWVGACCPEAAPGQLQGDRQQQQQQQQHDEKQQQQQEDRQQQQQQGDRQQQQQQDRQQQDKRQRRAVLASEPRLALAVAAADVVACLAARSGDAFLDGEAHPMLLPRHPQHLHGPAAAAAAAAASGGDSTAAWRLGLYGPEDSSDAAAAGSSEDSSCSEQQGSEGGGEEPHSMQAGAAAGGRSAGSAGSAAPRRVARWRWGSDGGVRPARSPSPSPQAGGGNSVVGTSAEQRPPPGGNSVVGTSAEQRPPPGGNSSSVAGGGGNNVADDDAVLARAAFVPLSLDGSHPGGRAPRDNAVALPALLADMLSAVGGSSGASAGGQVAAGCTTILQAAGSGSGGGSVGVGLCTGATPAFELPGVTLVLDSSGGEVALTPVFLSLAHLAGLLDAGRAAATALWVGERRAARARWRAHVEAGAAAALGGGGLAALLSGGGAAGGGGAAAGGASAAAAGDDISGEGSDEDGLGDPPEAKALLEELGERGGPPQRRAAGRPPPVVRPPVRTGIIGALNATALGMLSLAARGAAGLQELGDQVTLALPPLAELAVGLPGSVNVSGVFLEDALADAAAHNAALIRGRRGSVTNTTGSSNTTGRAAGAPCSDSCTRRTGGSSSSSSSSSSRHVSSPPPLDVPCLDALRLVLAAGWAIAADALNGSGELAAAVLGSGGSSSTGRRAAGGPSQLQVNDEGEVALRLALTVVAAPALPAPPARRAGLVTGTTSSSPDASEFEVGVHLNLSELLGLPSVRKASALSAERHGPGSAARGLLIIGDLGPLRASSGPGSSGPGPGSSGLDGGHGGGPLPHRPPPLGLALLRGVAAMPAAQDGGAAPPLGS